MEDKAASMPSMPELIIMLILIYFIYKMLFGGKKQKYKNLSIKQDLEIQDIPGYCEFPDDYFVRGVTHRLDNVIKWTKGKNLKLTFRRETKNRYDPNAIAIYGVSSKGRFHIGYIPAEIAEVLVEAKLVKDMKLRLLGVKITDKLTKEEKKKGFKIKTLINFDILIPCGRLKNVRKTLEDYGLI